MSQSSKPLAGKIALVTGASRGIGRATARRLAHDGAFVIAHYGASKKDAESLVDEIVRAGGSGVAIGADLADSKAVDRLAAEVRAILRSRDGKLDILVNNAGIAPFVEFAKTDEATFDKIFAINVKAPYRLTSALIEFIPDGGRVVFLTTAATKIYFPVIAAYAASKGAIDVLIKDLAAEYGPRGVRVNGVAPGAIQSDMTPFLNEEAGRAQVLSLQALQRVGQVDDVANVIGFLAGPDSAWVTGTILTASGGIKL
jgi:NAD(P)-dependent dehydrogenase (short-subunit alcohol dehydrogenase family)